MKIKTIGIYSIWVMVLASSSIITAKSKAQNMTSSTHSFSVYIEGELKFNEQSESAKAYPAKPGFVSFKAKGWLLRIMGLGLSETGDDTTTRLSEQNTMIAFYTEIDGKRKKIACKAGKDAVGAFNRTGLSATSISGDFSVKFSVCTEFMTGKAINFPAEPFTVTGQFKDITLK